MNPYFCVSHTVLTTWSLSLTTEVSYVYQKKLLAFSEQIPSQNWLKFQQFLKMAFIMGSFSYILQDLTKQTLLVAALTSIRSQR